MDEPLFVHDPMILFGKNIIKISFSTKNERVNTLARLVIYSSIGFATYKKEPKLLLYGIGMLITIGLVYSIGDNKIPMNKYYKLTSTKTAYNANPGLNSSNKIQEFKNNLLTNVRERNHYLGGDIEIPHGSHYMLGGTRPPAPNRTDALRNDKFFQNVHNQMFYEPTIPYRFL